MFDNLFDIFKNCKIRAIEKGAMQIVARVNALSDNYAKLRDDEIPAKTEEFRTRIKQGELLDVLLPDALALVRESSKRTIGLYHYDVQIMGAIVLHKGMIAEMKTGEGKTLVATMPAYLNALKGESTHIVTVNDYLAKRDAEWMGRVYDFMGLTVECLTHEKSEEQRIAAYKCNIVYATNSELGFDYLRDGMKSSASRVAQKSHSYAIIDEIDSVLIDEARVPLIMSGSADEDTTIYKTTNELSKLLSADDYELDEKRKNVMLTEDGINKIEKIGRDKGIIEGETQLYDAENMKILHHINQALKANIAYHKDKDYIIKNKEVLLIDEFTGRISEGRRLSDGLHQAIEAKEKLHIRAETQTLASITYQNYFKLYDKLSGMTGTAKTEAKEFLEIYNLQTVTVPTNRPISRVDENDSVYRTSDEKVKAIIQQIKECNSNGQPILVGTTSIDKSEKLSALLKKDKVKHMVLNAKRHKEEAEIIAQAGAPYAVTIATNMAGRGTDILLGGNVESLIKKLPPGLSDDVIEEKISEIRSNINKRRDEVLKHGGLYILGTERHESRRIDNQLRGRAGRQGDIGRSKFFVSLEDDLMRIFNSERVSKILPKLGMKEDEMISHKWINNALDKSQQRVESHNYDQRKNLLKYDNVINEQRQIIIDQRSDILESDDKKLKEIIRSMCHDFNSVVVGKYIRNNKVVDFESLKRDVDLAYPSSNIDMSCYNYPSMNSKLIEEINKHADIVIDKRYADADNRIASLLFRRIMLVILDKHWKEHMHMLDRIRKMINLKAYGHKDPLMEYRKESFDLFEKLRYRIDGDSIRNIIAADIQIIKDHSDMSNKE